MLDHADYPASTRKHELGHIQIRNVSTLKALDHTVGIDSLSDVRILLKSDTTSP